MATASENWPETLVMILANGYAEVPGPEPRRTQLEDGAVEQAVTSGATLLTRSFTFWVLQSNYDSFVGWIRQVNVSDFNYEDIDGTRRVVSIVGGAASVSLELVGDQLIGGERYWSGQIQLEGFV